MKVSAVFVCIAFIVIGSQAAPRTFNFGSGLSGAIDVFSNLEHKTTEAKVSTNKAEEEIRSLIQKHLESKKAAKKESSQPETVAANRAPVSIPWDEHKDARDKINDRIPGGTDLLDKLLLFLQEQRQRQASEKQ